MEFFVCYLLDGSFVWLTQSSGVSEQNASATLGGVHEQHQQQQPTGPRLLDADDDEGTEMKVIDNSSRTQFITHASLTVSQAAAAAGSSSNSTNNNQNQVDSGINFSSLEKNNTTNSNDNVNNITNKTELPFPPYNGKLMTIGAGSTLSFLSWTSLFGPTNGDFFFLVYLYYSCH